MTNATFDHHAKPYRCILDQRALAKWVVQHGKKCAAAVVAGALNYVHEGLALDLADAMLEFQSSWRSQIGILKSEIKELLDEENRVKLVVMLHILTTEYLSATYADEMRDCMCSLSPDPAVQEQLAILNRVAMSYTQVRAPVGLDAHLCLLQFHHTRPCKLTSVPCVLSLSPTHIHSSPHGPRAAPPPHA